MNEQEWLKQLEQEGFHNLRVCPIAPGETPEHTHDQHTVHIILSGELTIIDEHGTKTYQPGERIEFAAGTTHKVRGTTKAGSMIVGVKES